MWQKHYFLRITVWSELKFTPKNIHFTRIISVHPWQIACLHGASSHEIDYVGKFWEILNLEGHQNCITCSRVMAILLNGWTLPIGEAASGRVCTCSLRRRLVFIQARINQAPINRTRCDLFSLDNNKGLCPLCGCMTRWLYQRYMLPWELRPETLCTVVR